MRACTCCCHGSCASDIFYFTEQGTTSTALLGKDHFLPKTQAKLQSCLSHSGKARSNGFELPDIYRAVLKNAEACGGVHLLIGSSSLSRGGGAHQPGFVSITVCIFRAWFFRHVFICTVLGLTVSH